MDLHPLLSNAFFISPPSGNINKLDTDAGVVVIKKSKDGGDCFLLYSTVTELNIFL